MPRPTFIVSCAVHFCLLVNSIVFGVHALKAETLDGTTPPVVAQPTDSIELARLFSEDQADRIPKSGQMMDGIMMRDRDAKRLIRVKELYRTDQLRTGPDYFHAGMVLQHGQLPEDYLLAHEFCVVAISLGYQPARSLAAKSEDRFLRSIGRPQRFGTQYSSVLGATHTNLDQTDDGVTDTLRKQMNIQSLVEAKARESEMAARFPTKSNLILVKLGAAVPPDLAVLDLAKSDMMPEIVSRVEPVYPPELKAQGIEGFASVYFVVERDGTSTQVRLGKESSPGFGAAAVDAVTRWKFKPGQKGNQPVRVMVAIVLPFELPRK